MMSKEIRFYRPDANTSFESDDFWSTFRTRLVELDVRIMSPSEANGTGFFKLFDLLTSYRLSGFEVFDCLPRQEIGFEHFPIPYSYDEHCETEWPNGTLQDAIEGYVNAHFATKKFLFLCRPDHCIALEFSEFRYAIIDAMCVGQANEWIMICDASMNQAIFFCEDGCIGYYSHRSEYQDIEFCGKTNDFWVEYFNQNFAQGVPHGSQAFFDFVNANYRPRIRGLAEFTAITAG